MVVSSAVTRNLLQALAHYDQALALYNPTGHRPLVTRFGGDSAAMILSYRSRPGGCSAIRTQRPRN
jgi:hypothetical protein